MDTTAVSETSNWPLLAGSLVSWGLQGALSVQVYLYYTSFPNDPALRKWFVYGLFALEWVHTGCQTVGTFVTFTSSTPSTNGVAAGTQTFMIGTLASTALISAIVQIFYAWRILIISERRLRIVAGIIITLALVQMVACFVNIDSDLDSSLVVADTPPLIVNGTFLQPFSNTPLSLTPDQSPALIWLGGSALVDIIIAISMSFLLYRSRTMYAQTDAIISRVIRHVIESGTATAGVALVAMILYIIDSFYSGELTIMEDGAGRGMVELVQKTLTLSDFPILVLSKLYVNTALLSLNNRALLNKLPHNQDDLHTGRRHGLNESARRLRLAMARVYRRILGLCDSKAENTPYSITTTSSHWGSWNSGTFAAHEGMPRDIIDFGPSKVT